MVGNLNGRVGVVTTTMIATIITTMYFKDGTIFQDFPSNFIMVYCLEMSR
jgi:hypothetical protein